MYENPAELNGTPDFNVKRSVASVKTLGPLAQACFSAKGLGKHLVPEKKRCSSIAILQRRGSSRGDP